MDSFIDAGYHWIETTAASDSDVRTFQRGMPAPVAQVEVGRVHALAAHFETHAREDDTQIGASVWLEAADELRGLLKS